MEAMLFMLYLLAGSLFYVWFTDIVMDRYGTITHDEYTQFAIVFLWAWPFGLLMCVAAWIVNRFPSIENDEVPW